METAKIFGLLAFVATGIGLKVISLFNQTAPWVIVVILVAVGYFFGLLKHCDDLRTGG
ncbi:MAG: hypothetical protein ACOX3A_07560 [bacterium]|jgi:ABC-type multidrug transport system permease subunit